MFEKLLDLGADVNVMNNDGESAIGIAVINGNSKFSVKNILYALKF